MQNENSVPPSDQQQQLISRLKRSFMARMTMSEIQRSLPPGQIKRGLIITPDTGIFAYYLNRSHGTWDAMILKDSAAEESTVLAGGNVEVYDGQAFPYEDGSFDVLIIVGCLECVEDDADFIAQCHRVLQPDGKLVLNARNRKRVDLVGTLQHGLGISDDMMGWRKPGYTESEIFTVLKDGFDVHSMQTYSKFFVQCVNTCLQASRLKKSRDADVPVYHDGGYPLYVMAYQLDLILLFLTRGYRLVATAKRRAWRPRNTPILVDGRSISEAVLSQISE